MPSLQKEKGLTNIHVGSVVEHVIDIENELDNHFSHSFILFLREPKTLHQKVLPGLNVKRFDVNQEYNVFSSLMEQSSLYREFEWSKYKNGIIVCLSIPEHSPCPEYKDMMRTNYNRKEHFWFYGDTYEEAVRNGQAYLVDYINNLLEAKHSHFISSTVKSKRLNPKKPTFLERLKKLLHFS